MSKREVFESIGNRPIGETMLYNDPAVVRGDFEIKRITHDDPLLFDAVVHQNFYEAEYAEENNWKELWARRSKFYISDKPLLVTEVFLLPISSCIED